MKKKIAYLVHNKSNGGIPLELGFELKNAHVIDLIICSELSAKYRFYYNMVFRKKYDVVHVHHSEQLIVFSLLRFFSKFTLIFTLHNDFNRQPLKTRIIYFFSSLMADLIVCNSKSTRSTLPKYFKTKSITVYNGVNEERLNRFDMEAYNMLNASKNYVLFANRLVRQKNMIKSLRGVLRGISPFENWIVVVAGDGSMRFSIEDEFSDEIRLGKLVLLGDVEREKVYGLMKKASIYVLLSNWEGFGNSIVEASKFIRNIIHSDLLVFEELFGGHYETVDQTNVEEITRCVVKMIESYEDNSNERTIVDFVRKFSISNAMKNHIDVYEQY